MAYINQAYFSQYTTAVIDAAEFAPLAERASDVIDMLTMQRIGGAAALPALPPAMQEAIKKATAAEIETLYAEGGIEALTGNADSAFPSASLGKFSLSKGDSSGLQTVNGIPISPLIDGYLFMTGLLNKKVQVCDRYRENC